MLVEKDLSLEKHIQFALWQNLHEISEQCVRELRQLTAEYGASLRTGALAEKRPSFVTPELHKYFKYGIFVMKGNTSVSSKI